MGDSKILPPEEPKAPARAEILVGWLVATGLSAGVTTEGKRPAGFCRMVGR